MLDPMSCRWSITSKGQGLNSPVPMQNELTRFTLYACELRRSTFVASENGMIMSLLVPSMFTKAEDILNTSFDFRVCRNRGACISSVAGNSAKGLVVE